MTTPQQYEARNPLTGEVDYRFDVDSREAVDAACAAVRAAQPAWAALTLDARMDALRELGRAFERDQAKLVAALVRDTGRHRIAAVECMGVQGLLQQALANAQAVLGPRTEKPSVIPGIASTAQLVPYAVVGNIAPWNFPFILSMIDTLPALLAGCAVVIKPSEVTPRYVEPLRDIIASVPAVAKVLKIVRGPGQTGADLVDFVDAIVLTGSVRTGRKVAEAAARRFIPAFLELGGKDPAIVTRTADLDRAANVVVRASVAASGQACQSLERVYVDRAVYEPFVKRVIDEARKVRTTAESPTGQIGPFIMGRQADIVKEHIDDAVAKGARIEVGGKIIERGGRWCEATVLTGVNHTMKVMTEETFGPVIPIMAYDTLDEAIRLANDGEYGLSANVFAGDESEARAIAARLDAGFVSIGDASMSSFVADFEWEGFRFSGLGRSRMGPSGIARYLRVKAVTVHRGTPANVGDFGDQPG